MSTDLPDIPFSQRTGLKSVPPQLQLGEVSEKLRRLIDYYVGLEIDRETLNGFDHSYFGKKWERVTQDLWVIFLDKSANGYKNSPYSMRQLVEDISGKSDIGVLFDFVEFLLQHPYVSQECKNELGQALVQSRSAYRIVDGRILAVGTDQQAEVFSQAIEAADENGAHAARSHLVQAGSELKNGDWASSVRESIHAVEARSRKLAPEAKTLAPALKALQVKGHLHGSLKEAFSKLYGYSNDEEGVRHALVFNEEAKVDETDALFMLGACASFVSYLISRSFSDDE
ncbi:MAG: hypothetical protein WAP44_04860 [Lentibacter algarum]|uniref:AbiJ-NTD4 domain-containing protein n=1 Tax=Lentibacter algarum TaxID=576131 RepID=UPI003BB0737A